MNDPYETLGVARDATPEQIKAAYRRCSSKAHPDRAGGSEERMRAVNAANDILSNPEKRERYDRTGEATPTQTLEDKADSIMSSWFTEALDKDKEPISYARAGMMAKRGELRDVQHNAQVDVKKYEKRIGKTKRKSNGKNLVELALQERIKGKKHLIAQAAEALEVLALALQVVEDYESLEVPEVVDRRTPLQKAQQRFADMQQGRDQYYSNNV